MTRAMYYIKSSILYLIPAPVIVSAISDLFHGQQNTAPFLLAIVVMYYAIMRKIDSLVFRVTDLEKHMDEISHMEPNGTRKR